MSQCSNWEQKRFIRLISYYDCESLKNYIEKTNVKVHLNKNLAMEKALERGSLSIVKYLETFPKVDITLSKRDNNSLKLAVDSGNLYLVRYLLNHQKFINNIDYQELLYRTCGTWFIRSNYEDNKKIQNYLLKHVNEINEKNQKGFFLQAIYKNDRKSFIKFLKDSRFDKNKLCYELINLCFKENHPFLKTFLKQQDINFSLHTSFLIKKAVEFNSLPILKIIFNNPNIFFDSKSIDIEELISTTIKKDYFDIFKFLYNQSFVEHSVKESVILNFININFWGSHNHFNRYLNYIIKDKTFNLYFNSNEFLKTACLKSDHEMVEVFLNYKSEQEFQTDNTPLINCLSNFYDSRLFFKLLENKKFNLDGVYSKCLLLAFEKQDKKLKSFLLDKRDLLKNVSHNVVFDISKHSELKEFSVFFRIGRFYKYWKKHAPSYPDSNLYSYFKEFRIQKKMEAF